MEIKGKHTGFLCTFRMFFFQILYLWPEAVKFTHIKNFIKICSLVFLLIVNTDRKNRSIDKQTNTSVNITMFAQEAVLKCRNMTIVGLKPSLVYDSLNSL